MEMKRCVQCGILKDEGQFRKYTYSSRKGTSGRYRICKDCEALNTKYRRAVQSGDIETAESIRNGYEALEAIGYRTPLSAKPNNRPVEAELNKILQHHGVSIKSVITRTPVPEEPTATFKAGDATESIPVSSFVELEVPEELQYWLDVDTQEWIDNDISPEYLQETIYESLKAKYRPQIGVDKERFIPIYDDTYKTVLNAILRRFDDYEEQCSADETIELNDDAISQEGGDD